jgi:hypothetical protein
VGLLINVIDNYLEAGRLKHTRMSPYLAPAEGLQAVHKYAEFYQEPITKQTAVQINELCLSDPFFISCVIQSDYEEKDLTTSDGVINTVHYEISDRESEMSKTWNEYLHLTLDRVDDINAKNMLLHLTKHQERYWTPAELKDKLGLSLEIADIRKKLIMLSEADLIVRGGPDIDFRGLQDGTLNLVLRHRLEKEINGFAPDLKQEFRSQTEQNRLEQKLAAENRSLRGKLNRQTGEFAEHQLANAFRSRKRFALSEFFDSPPTGGDTTELNVTQVQERVPLLRSNGKAMNIDVIAESSCGRVVLVEVKIQKSTPKMVEYFL